MIKDHKLVILEFKRVAAGKLKQPQRRTGYELRKRFLEEKGLEAVVAQVHGQRVMQHVRNGHFRQLTTQNGGLLQPVANPFHAAGQHRALLEELLVPQTRVGDLTL